MKARILLATLVGALLAFSLPVHAQDKPQTLMDFFRAKRQVQEEPANGKPAEAAKRENAKAARQPVALTENDGELRSEERRGFFGGVRLRPETQALDGVLHQRQAKKSFKVKPEFEPQTVEFSGYSRGTIVIDTGARYLYLVESSRKARRYAIAVGREGLEFKGTATVGDKQEWPRWFPTEAMQKREPAKYGQYKDGMNGGADNPLGARAIYLYQGKRDTHVRIHGTNQPQTIGTNSSNGCFRMVNDHVIDLYNRVRKGTQVVVL